MSARGGYSLEIVAGMAVLGGIIAVLLLALVGAGSEDSQHTNSKPDSGSRKSAASGTTEKRPRSNPNDEQSHYVGLAAGGCATSNCHGGVETPGAIWKTSAFVVQQLDPHAQAFDVLFAQRSREILHRITQPGQRESLDDADFYLQQLETHCVSCHAAPLPQPIDALPVQERTPLVFQHFAQGVSCEACHGPASRWMPEHLSGAWVPYERQPDVEKASFGFRDLADRSIAAKTCAACHIGSPPGEDEPRGREVTHDLIAAGHPRLDFDFAAWYAAMPKHWEDAREQQVDFHSRAWIEGQVESLLARTRLVASQRARAQLSARGATAPWPELSNFDCFACHHALRLPQTDALATGHTVSGTQLSFGASWKLLDQLVPDTAAVNERLGTLLASPVAASAPAAEPSLPALSVPADFRSTRLAQALIGPPQEAGSDAEIRSWDEMASWYYAAAALVRDAEFETQDAPMLMAEVTAGRDGIRTLRTSMEQFITLEGTMSRYASPRGFPHGQEPQQADEVVEAFREAQRAIGRLAKLRSPDGT